MCDTGAKVVITEKFAPPSVDLKMLPAPEPRYTTEGDVAKRTKIPGNGPMPTMLLFVQLFMFPFVLYTAEVAETEIQPVLELKKNMEL